MANPFPYHLALKESEGSSFAEWRSSYFPKKLPFDDGLFDLSSFHFPINTYFGTREEVGDILISSLQFILQTINMLGLRWRITAFKRQLSKKAPPSAADLLLLKTIEALHLEGEVVEGDEETWPFREESALFLRRNRASRLEIELIDSFDRSWLGPFLQVESLKAAKGEGARQIALQTSLFGALEPLMGVMIEDHLGQRKPLPLPIAPWQISIASGKGGEELAKKLAAQLKLAGYLVRIARKAPLKEGTILDRLIPFHLLVEEGGGDLDFPGQISLLREGRPQKIVLSALFQLLERP